MKKLIFCCLLVFSLNSFAQQRLLSKKIVYTVPITEKHIKSSSKADTVVYNYIVNRRFFWEAMDLIMKEIKNKKLYFHSFSGDTIIYDSMINNLTKQLNRTFLKTFSKKDIQNVLDNDIRAIQFQEEWTYNPQNMLINKKVIAYNPIIEMDSVALIGEDLQAKPCFSFSLGWIYPKGEPIMKDTILICRNIQYNIPIYNYKPYSWWDNNLEAEYSLPYFSLMFAKTENGEIKTFEDPNASDPFTKLDILKRKEYRKMESVFVKDKNNNEKEVDSNVVVTYDIENIDHLRFGEEIYFDENNLNFIKNTNYIAPLISIFGEKDNDFRGFYPLYYIRRR